MTPELFTHLAPEACSTLDILQGDLLFRQNQQTSGFYQVITGSITLRRTTAAGDTLTLHRASAGGHFAEASIFSDRYHCDAICTQAGRVLKIAKTDVLALLQTDAAFCQSFMRMLAAQVQQDRALIEILAIRAAKERVLSAVQAGYLHATIPEFASRINLSVEACYRALRALCVDGRMVQTGRGQYRLPT